jgi:type IV secretion system protein VirB10
MRLKCKRLTLTLLSAAALQFGLAGSVAAQSTTAAESAQTANSQPAPAVTLPAANADPAAANPANGSTAAIPKKTYTVPAGTKVLLQLRSSVNTKSARAGDGVYLSSAFPVVVGNHVMIPSGVFVQGIVDRVVRAGRVSGKSQLDMHFTSIIFPNGSVVEIPGVVSGLPGASKQDVKNGEGTIEQDKDKGRNAGKTAEIALPTGATVGSIAGISSGHSLAGGLGGLGAGLATVGLVTLFTRGADVSIEAGTQVEMVLQRPLILEEENLAEGTVPGASPAMVPSASQPKPMQKPGHPDLLCPPGGLGCS